MSIDLSVRGRVAYFSSESSRGKNAKKDSSHHEGPSRVRSSSSHEQNKPDEDNTSNSNVSSGAESQSDVVNSFTRSVHSQSPADSRSIHSDLSSQQIEPSFMNMQTELDNYGLLMRAQQERSAIAARGEFLRQRLESTILGRQSRIDPHAYQWTETPWVMGSKPNSPARSWIGEPVKVKDKESPLEAEIWRAMRHGEAREFPLEDKVVSEELFGSLLQAMVSDDMDDISQQWRSRAVSYRQHSIEQSSADEIPSESLASARTERRTSIGAGRSQPLTRNCRWTANYAEQEDSRSESSDTLFSPTATATTPSPFLTPSHSRSRSFTDHVERDRGQMAARPMTISRRRLEEDLNRAKAKERLELEMKFRATPIPSSSLVPRYFEIMSGMNTKSAEARAVRAAQLLASTKPFSFSNDERNGRCTCKSLTSKVIQDAFAEVNEEAAKRERRARARSAIFRPRSLSLNAADDGIKRRQRIIENERRAGLTREHVFRPAVNHSIPDYNEIFVRTKRQRSITREPTRPQPFQGLEDHQRIQQLRQSSRKRSMDAARVKKLSKVNESWKAQIIAEAHTPPRETRSSILRTKTIQNAIKEDEDRRKTLAEEEQEKRQRLHNTDMAKLIRKRMQLAQKDKGQASQCVSREIRIEQRSMEKEYKESLIDMKRRLEQRLCLFEQIQVDAAKLKARKDCERILQRSRVL